MGEELDGQLNDEFGGGIVNQVIGFEDLEQLGFFCLYVFFNLIFYFDCFSYFCKDYDRMKFYLFRKYRISDYYCFICFVQFIIEEELEVYFNLIFSDDCCVVVIGYDGIIFVEWDDVFNFNCMERNNSDKCF